MSKVFWEWGVFLREHLGCAYESRKFVHMGAACWILFWPLFDVVHWSWRLNILVPAVMSIKLFYKGAILKDPDDIDVRTMSRSSAPSELLYGPLQFTIFMMYVGTQLFMTLEGAILVAALGIGDGVAPIIGKYYGNISYRLPLCGRKSIEGSFFGVFLGTIGGILLFTYALGLRTVSYQGIAACAAIATLAEASALEYCDNIWVPVVLHFSLTHYPWLMQ
mmetsp:Transcript_21333/g.31366  ORF Transcript_21333/g.31366 Transcript_21333/m.31366 type:complete len:220 (+) Transcript_21333:279-938(+)